MLIGLDDWHSCYDIYPILYSYYIVWIVYQQVPSVILFFHAPLMIYVEGPVWVLGVPQ